MEKLALACIVWVELWSLTTGLLGTSLTSLVTMDLAARVLRELLFALALLVPIIALHRKYNAKICGPSGLRFLYVVPIGLAISLRERLSARPAVPFVAVMYYLCHAIFIPEKFAPWQLLPSVAILALGWSWRFCATE